ncbi:YidC/Oxa1 family membrane protein insertase [Bacillus pakistanensis]|uniref:Membrane protein insertase YidC n=1 Tax=Rossellomorea pakistanensis TaxID=992288 RepID=A0ABS2N8C6_9BACI|nr:membrane protein insertase YidC [Bacillus pakistanensis]MBM7584116.1 YidC/Oxa1 family membrane protein insertase [Bacillus pakistanensis]
MKKKIFSLMIIISTVVSLSGCSNASEKGTLFHNYLVQPFVTAIHEIGLFYNGNFGLSIITITVIIRLIMLPFMMRNYKNQQNMKVKMELIKPELTSIQQKIKETKNPEEQRKLQQEMMQLYSKHGVNPLNMGCLPLILQMPVLIGLYYAIRTSEEIASHSFLWFNLGHPDILMPIVAGVIYLIQAKVSLIGMPVQQQKQMKIFSYMSPIMILIFSFNVPAALPLYWATGGAFLILQTLLARKLYFKKTSKELIENHNV